ncbi:MAG TPA: PKD domain-containing protein, partial [Prolixibacteraceae bacterium]|nr:PKD domain-containing protein [Prolixibacteraceae bacterium]
MKKQHYLKVISTIIGLIISFSLYSQKEANNWLCSNFGLKFQNDSVILQQDYAVEDGMGVGIISDHNGNLLFYTDGFTVWNANHDQMPHGNELIPKGGSYVRETIIIPKPGTESIFYIFTVDPKFNQESSGLYFSIVDMSLDNGLGNITEKGVRILNDTSNKITAVLHKNKKDVWLITHKFKTNSYYSYLITDAGISESPVISSVGHVVTSSFNGQLKASPDGRMIACSYYEWNDESTDFDLFSFNSSTGQLYNPMSFKLPVSEYSGDGLEFSSDASKLFVIQQGGGLYQYNLKNNTYDEIANSQMLLSYPDYNIYVNLQLAPNGKIYITKGGGSGGEAHLGVIENPNEYGEKCIILENGFYLGEKATSVTRLSHFIQNYFFSPNFVVDNNCQGTDINFGITNDYNLDSVRWNFGDGSSTNDINPVVKYQSSGEYIIQMIAYYPGYSDTITKNITIHPFPVFKLNSDSAVCRGAELSVPAKFKS